ncbi:hypothetical protein VNI00_016267 [Paramarasmius palmivorus]|uniref:Uncharacterized protein n=1 Tax=Paramarasmius palmivorus TaxID=297713 RepID=A0AAW0BCY5_9AGAR
MPLLYALARPIASSLSASSTNSSTSFDPITGECIDINGCRTTTGIVWSCLSVIFICTWVAIHPNIPTVEKFDRWRDRWTGDRWHPAVVVYQNVELMVVALLAPEFMILWAMRQREQAKKIQDKFKDKYGWGMSHGFFVIMGGLALYDGDKFCGYLWDRDRSHHPILRPYDGTAEKHLRNIKSYHEEHRKHCLKNTGSHNENTPGSPTPSEQHDHSSTANTPENEPLTINKPQTILEFLVAKGYITLTEDEIKDNLSHSDVITKSIAVIQTIWFIMQVIARAVKGLAITELEIVTVGFAILNFGTYFLWWNKPLRVRHPVRVYWRQTEKSGAGDTNGGKGGISGVCWEGAGAVVEYIYAIPLFGEILGPENVFRRLLLLPLWTPSHIFVVCFEILQDEDDSRLAIPISSRLDDNPLHLYIAVYGIAALFGAIHCIPWVFQFPTHTEQLLWRISAVAVAVAPVAMGGLHGYLKHVQDRVSNFWDTLALCFTILLSLAYTVFRIILLVIAFTALRDLRPSAYQTVQWTTFWPHIG